MTILVVGRGFIGRAIAAALQPGEARLASHEDAAEPALMRGVATLVHAGRDPRLGSEAWRLEDDLELKLARAAAMAQISVVSLGTRRVYAPAPGRRNEADRVGPVDLYGQQKLRLEHALHALLGRHLTRLRLANIIGYEALPGRSTFMGLMLQGLKRREEIRFDMSPFVRRDFLPVELCGRWLAELARRPPGGIVNVGSGVALECGRLALWLIEGYGQGRLVIDDPAERDSFVLDVRRLTGLVGSRRGCSPDELRRYVTALGWRLREELERR